MTHPRLSSADHVRLQQHLDSIRDVENTFGGMANEAADQCATAGLNVSQIEALKDLKFDRYRTDEIIQLQLSLVALAFACNYRRSASVQWGDAYDRTIYRVPSNDREWTMTQVGHRLLSDNTSGNDPLAAQAHIEIDAVRMSTLAAGLDHFEARGLGDQCLVVWTNQFADGPRHTTLSVPHIVWGSPRGLLKQGAYVDAGGTNNNRMLNALISAAISDTGKTVEDFGDGEGGQLEVVLA